MSLFEIESEHFGGEVKVIKPTIFQDERGSLTVTFLQDEFKTLGLPNFVRYMYTRSEYSVLRGLHFQTEPAMGKLIQVIKGEAFLVAVDLRYDSPTFLGYHGIFVSEDNPLQVWASSGFARGYCALSEETLVQYSCDEYKGDDSAIRWNDPDIGIDWPVDNPKLSVRDAQAPTAAEFFGGKQ